MRYKQYLQSKHWRTKRLVILKRDDNRCTECNRLDNLNVHHLNYNNLWNEQDGDLITLCYRSKRGRVT